jgi:hypothetical protein
MLFAGCGFGRLPDTEVPNFISQCPNFDRILSIPLQGVRKVVGALKSRSCFEGLARAPRTLSAATFDAPTQICGDTFPVLTYS